MLTNAALPMRGLAVLKPDGTPGDAFCKPLPFYEISYPSQDAYSVRILSGAQISGPRREVVAEYSFVGESDEQIAAMEAGVLKYKEYVAPILKREIISMKERIAHRPTMTAPVIVEKGMSVIANDGHEYKSVRPSSLQLGTIKFQHSGGIAPSRAECYTARTLDMLAAQAPAIKDSTEFARLRETFLSALIVGDTSYKNVKLLSRTPNEIVFQSDEGVQRLPAAKVSHYGWDRLDEVIQKELWLCSKIIEQRASSAAPPRQPVSALDSPSVAKALSKLPQNQENTSQPSGEAAVNDYIQRLGDAGSYYENRIKMLEDFLFTKRKEQMRF